jgi:hypothetical protein
VCDRVNPPLAAGEIVTTGTLTRALPVSAGETWRTELTGVALDGLCVRGRIKLLDSEGNEVVDGEVGELYSRTP